MNNDRLTHLAITAFRLGFNSPLYIRIKYGSHYTTLFRSIKR